MIGLLCVCGSARMVFGLKDLPVEEQVATLRSRLKEAGAAFKGSTPTQAEITKARQLAELASLRDGLGVDPEDLDLDSGRGRRSRKVVDYAAANGVPTDDEADEMDSEEEAERKRQAAQRKLKPGPKKKAAQPKSKRSAGSGATDEGQSGGQDAQLSSEESDDAPSDDDASSNDESSDFVPDAGSDA